MVGVFGRFTFEQAGEAMLTIEAGCHFQVTDESWERFCPDKQRDVVTLPMGFAQHLATITVGTTRGILHVRTEQTAYSTLVLPTINVNDLVMDNIMIE